MTVSTVRHGDVEIAYETIGPQAGEPLLLVMGTGTQMLAWHPGFCAALVERGFQVTRFDNRDCGLSTRFTADGPPNQLKMWLRPASVAAYRLEDMADDAVAVLDAQGHQSAHVVGCSLGGMIAQVMATRQPERVRTLTSISSTPSPQIGRTRLGTLVRFAKVVKKPVTDADSLAQQMIDLQPFTGSPDYPPDLEWLRELARQSYERGYDLAGSQRQTAAIAAAGDRRRDLATLRTPTLVIHGEADQIIRPIAGRETARVIPGAVLVTYPGMGHNLPRELWPAITREIHEHTQRAPLPH